MGFNNEEIFYNTTQVAKILKVSRRTVYNWINEKEIPYYRQKNGRYRIPKSAIDKKLSEIKEKSKDKIREIILEIIYFKKVLYLREIQINLEDLFYQEKVTEMLDILVEEEEINTHFDGNRWYFPKEIELDEVKDIIEYKRDLMETYINHPKVYRRRGVIYDDYSEMLVEDAFIKNDYKVVAKNTQYFNGKVYDVDAKIKPGRKRDLDYICYVKEKEYYLGVQIKNRLEYPKMNDVKLLLDLCHVLELIPMLITRISHPRIYDVFKPIKGEVIQFKRYFKQPPFPRDKYKQIENDLGIPIGVYKWVPDFLINQIKRKVENI